MKDKIVIGSRESRLAVIQSQMVLDFIKAHHPALDVELLTMKTTGDIILDRTLDKVGGKGLFVKELDRALMDGRDYVLPEDVQRMAEPVLAHRLVLSPEARMRNMTPQKVLSTVLSSVPVPVKTK